ncbi:hypothetical protein RLIN73S_03731 [Rhodanobacter lindaniclasticus]
MLANPYGKLFNAIDPHSYTVHPYQRPTIGSIEDLEAASLQNVIDFHHTFYRPDNATLIVAGDFDPKQLDAWVDQYFGWIPKPATPIPQVTAKEPVRKQDKRYTVTSETAPLPAVAMTLLIPPAADSADRIPLQVAAALLSQGDSSRLYQSLVYRHQVAQEVGAFADTRGPGLFTAYAILASGHQPAEAEKLLNEEIVWLATQPIGDAELDKVKTQLLTSELKQRQTAQGIAFALGQASLIDGNVEHVNDDLVALQKVSADDVHRVLRKHATGAKKVTIDYLPQAKAAPAAAKGDGNWPPPPPPAAVFAAIVFAAGSASAAEFPTTPPAPGPAPQLNVPTPTVQALPERPASHQRAPGQPAAGDRATVGAPRRRDGSAAAGRPGRPHRQPAEQGRGGQERAADRRRRRGTGGGCWNVGRLGRERHRHHRDHAPVAAGTGLAGRGGAPAGFRRR